LTPLKQRPEIRSVGHKPALAGSRLWRTDATVKVELVHDAAWATRAVARLELVEYLEVFYNGQRRHSALG